MIIQNIVVGIVETNCYIVYQEEAAECIVIDPGDKAEEILSFAKAKGLEVKGILLTHGHFDHVMAVEEIRRQTGAKMYACEAEHVLLEESSMNTPSGIHSNISLKADCECEDGQYIELAGLKVKVIHTPGHTGGSVCYYIEERGVLFSGDTLFFESIGRTDFPTGNHAAILHSIKSSLFVLPDQVKVFPGHGPGTTIGYEKENNPYFGINGSYS